MDPIVKKFLNTLRCPVCQSQIDMLVKSRHRNNYGCVQDSNHYSLLYIHNELPYRLERENVQVFHGKYLYDIKQVYYLTQNYLPEMEMSETSISIKKVDKEQRVLDQTKSKDFVYNKILFDFRKTDRERIINRVQTILVFQ